MGLVKDTPTADGTPRWEDGNPSQFIEWAPGEPNEQTTCIRYRPNGFADRPCDTHYFYTCKKAA